MSLPTRSLGTHGPTVGADRPRVHELQPGVRRFRRRRPDEVIRRALDLGRDDARHRRRLRSAHQRARHRQGDRRAPRRRGHRHQVRDHVGAQRRAARRGRRHPRPTSGPRSRGRWTGSASTTSTSTTSTAPTRRADRGDGRGDGRARRRGQGAPPRAVRGVRRHDPPRRGRAPDRRAAERVVAVEPRHRGRGRADVPGARHRHRPVQPARPRDAHRADHVRSTTSPNRTCAAAHPRFRDGAFEANLAAVDVVREIAAATGPRPVRWRWPGCSPRVPTSCRSPARSASPTSRRTSAPSTSSLTADDLARLDAVTAVGERWVDPSWVYRNTPPLKA